MFVQVIRGRVTGPEQVHAALDRWSERLAAGAEGWLGTTAGVTGDGRFVALARFESEEAARRNSDRSEQGQWWAETSQLFTGEVSFRDSSDVTVDVHGDPGQAGFVQVMQGRGSDPDRARELMKEVHLAGDGARLVRNLSYGEQRQLEIAVALAGDPKLLLLDEPTSGMSPSETARMIELVATLPRTLSILMIEHDMKVVFTVADRITVLYYGRVLATGTPAEVRTNERVREVYLGMAH